MKLIKTNHYVINMAHVACILRDPSGSLVIHFAVPQGEMVPEVPCPNGAIPPVATSHMTLGFPPGEQADEVWRQASAASDPDEWETGLG